jgi:hypothetical protein
MWAEKTLKTLAQRKGKTEEAQASRVNNEMVNNEMVNKMKINK